MRRTPLVLVAVVCAAAALSACGNADEPSAATVDSSRISRTALNDELQAIAGNPAFAATLKKQQIDLAPTKGSITAELSSEWLNLLVNQVLVDKEFERRHLKVNAKNRADAKTAAAAIFGGSTVFNKFPRWFRDEVTGRQERVEALSSTFPALPPPDETTLRKFFEDSMSQTCVTKQVVEHILVPTKEEADAIEAQLAQGADFATLARERSTDTGSAQRGGALWCTASQQFVDSDPDFKNGVVPLHTGDTSAPVKSKFGYHIIRLAPWDFANARGLAAEAYAQQRESALALLLSRQLRRAKLWVDPRYGNVHRGGGTVTIQQPKAPNPKSRPRDTTPSNPLSTLGQ